VDGEHNKERNADEEQKEKQGTNLSALAHSIIKRCHFDRL
jgi:hypothetical protein